jgi:hypothetical protein
MDYCTLYFFHGVRDFHLLEEALSLRKWWTGVWEGAMKLKNGSSGDSFPLLPFLFGAVLTGRCSFL